MDTQEQQAVAGARDTLARVISGGSHADRSHAIKAIRSIDRGWRDDVGEWTVTHRLAMVYDARFELLGSFSENTDTLAPSASTKMQAALYAIDHLAVVLMNRLAAAGAGIYPTMGAPAGEMKELPAAQEDPLLSAIEQPAD
jgi:hypothetical protein